MVKSLAQRTRLWLSPEGICFVGSSLNFQNYKYQTISNDQNSKIQTMSRPGRFWSLNIGIWDLFEIWCLEFVILDTKRQGRAVYLWPGPEDQVFWIEINSPCSILQAISSRFSVIKLSCVMIWIHLALQAAGNSSLTLKRAACFDSTRASAFVVDFEFNEIEEDRSLAHLLFLFFLNFLFHFFEPCFFHHKGGNTIHDILIFY